MRRAFPQYKRSFKEATSHTADGGTLYPPEIGDASYVCSSGLSILFSMGNGCLKHPLCNKHSSISITGYGTSSYDMHTAFSLLGTRSTNA